jgi:hypothetical protein
MRQPAWLLLLWAALVASVVAAWLGFAARGRLADDRPLRSAALTLFMGVFVYGPLYGLAFEAIGAATLLLGGALGTLHGASFAAITLSVRRQPGGRRPDTASIHGRRIVARLVYGAILGLLYIVPSR